MEKSHRVLFKISTSFPFNLFPDKIVIGENKVNMIAAEFIASVQTHSILIEDVQDIFVSNGLFFANLKVTNQKSPNNSINLKYLRKDKAEAAHRQENRPAENSH